MWLIFLRLLKGYKIQVESGLDMKKGYSFVELSPQEGFGFSFTSEKGREFYRTIYNISKA